jgi:hypothetical protein
MRSWIYPAEGRNAKQEDYYPNNVLKMAVAFSPLVKQKENKSFFP